MYRFFKIVAILSLIATLFGCAYFNTFYNAKKFFAEAEELQRSPSDKPSRQQIELYDKCIERCAKVVTQHKKSKYRDDALFLMGKAFLGKGEPHKAINTFEQLITNYPRSEFVDEASLLIGQAYYSQNQPDLALEIFRDTVANYPDRSFAVRAQYLLADIYYEDELYERAIEEYEKVFDMKHKDELVGVTYARIAESYYALEDYENAYENFIEAARIEEDRTERFNLTFKAGDCLLKMEDYEGAHKLYRDLLSETTAPQDEARVRVRIARANIGLGEDQVGWEILNTVAEENRNSLAAKEAFFELGKLMEQEADYDSAMTFFDQAKRSSGSDEDLALAVVQKSNEITYLLNLKKNVDDPTKAAANYFALGEIYLMDYERIDQAMNYYRTVVDSFPETKYAVGALFALGYIMENKLSNPDSADVLYGHILAEHPHTDYANAIRTRFGIPIQQASYEIPEPEPEVEDTTATQPSRRELATPADTSAVTQPQTEAVSDTAGAETGQVTQTPGQERVRTMTRRDEQTPAQALADSLARVMQQAASDSVSQPVPPQPEPEMVTPPDSLPVETVPDSMAAPETAVPMPDSTATLSPDVPAMPTETDTISPPPDSIEAPPSEPVVPDSVETELPPADSLETVVPDSMESAVPDSVQ